MMKDESSDQRHGARTVTPGVRLPPSSSLPRAELKREFIFLGGYVTGVIRSIFESRRGCTLGFVRADERVNAVADTGLRLVAC
jgi:hypothetical protein